MILIIGRAEARKNERQETEDSVTGPFFRRGTKCCTVLTAWKSPSSEDSSPSRMARLRSGIARLLSRNSFRNQSFPRRGGGPALAAIVRSGIEQDKATMRQGVNSRPETESSCRCTVWLRARLV